MKNAFIIKLSFFVKNDQKSFFRWKWRISVKCDFYEKIHFSQKCHFLSKMTCYLQLAKQVKNPV